MEHNTAENSEPELSLLPAPPLMTGPQQALKMVIVSSCGLDPRLDSKTNVYMSSFIRENGTA